MSGRVMSYGQKLLVVVVLFGTLTLHGLGLANANSAHAVSGFSAPGITLDSADGDQGGG